MLILQNQNNKIYRQQAYAVVAQILEDIIVDDDLDNFIPLEYEQDHADKIKPYIESIMNEFLEKSK